LFHFQEQVEEGGEAVARFLIFDWKTGQRADKTHGRRISGFLVFDFFELAVVSRLWPRQGSVFEHGLWRRGRRPLHREELRELRNGEIEYSVKLSSMMEIRAVDIGLGEHARAVAPRELVREVARAARRVTAMYRGKSG